MHTHRFHTLAALLVAPLAGMVAACSTAREPAADRPPPTIVDGGARGTCDEKAAAGFVGRTVSETVSDQAKAAAGARGVRIIRPGMAVTMDHRAGRLNLHVDDKGVINRVTCG